MSKELQAFNLALPVNSLDSYIYRVNQIPMLSEQEELDLGHRLHQNNDLDAAKQLVMAHLRYVVRVAKSFSGYGLALADLIQEGNIGLMKAVKRFNPDLKVRLVSFAVHWIKAEIHEFVLKNWRIVKVATTKAQRKLFFKLRSAKKYLGWFTNAEINAVAKDLEVKPETVREMEMRLHANDAAFDGFATGEDEDAFAPAQYLEDKSLNPAFLLETDRTNELQQTALYEALQGLDARSQDILQTRWLNDEKATLHDLAAKYNISAERVRQLEKAAMAKLKAVLLKKAA